MFYYYIFIVYLDVSELSYLSKFYMLIPVTVKKKYNLEYAATI